MAAQQSQNLEMVPVFGDDQEFVVSIDKKHIFSASYMKKIDHEYVMLHKFVQQPSPTLGSFGTMESNTTGKMLIPRMPVLTDSVKQDGNEGTPIHAVPLSWSTPNEIVIWQEIPESERVRRTQLPYIDRKENWIIRRLPRSKPNRWDTYYVHLKTDIQFRSLIDVHTFIVHGILPERRKAKTKGDDERSNAMITTPPSRKVRGDKLLKRVLVGYYNLSTHYIFRNEISCVEGDTSTPIGNGKRKREDEASSQINQVNHIVYSLYDFEPIV